MSTEIIKKPSQQENDSKAKILVIDDDPAILEIMDNYLSSKGFTPLLAEEGRAGLDLFARESPDLVLLDLRLPGIDGLEVLSYLVKDAPGIPVIIISGLGTVKDAADSLKKGAWDYITKPIFDMQVLDIAVHNVLERARLLREKSSYQRSLEEELKKGTTDLEQRSKDILEDIKERFFEVEASPLWNIEGGCGRC